MTTVTDSGVLQGGALPGWRTGAALAAWFALVWTGLEAGVFWAGPHEAPVVLLLAILAPPALFAAGYAASAGFRRFVLSLDLRLLTAIQCWRVVGGAFIAMQAHALLPGLFAYPAGYGDLLVDWFALFALMALLRRALHWRTILIGLNVLGLADFAGAVATGLLASTGPLGLLEGEISMAALQQFPLSVIPTFLVPLWIIIHLASLLQLCQLAGRRRSPAELAA